MATIDDNSSDLDKIFAALGIFGGFGGVSSFEDVMELFGLGDLPTTHRWGILFGCVVFTVTVSVVLSLLVMGGSFQRMEEQSRTGRDTVPDAVTSRRGRPLLMEHLLDAQTRMVQKYDDDHHGDEKKQNGNNSSGSSSTEVRTPLTQMLLNVAPKLGSVGMSELIDEDGKKSGSSEKKDVATYIPEGYQNNYVHAYRRCQDSPGGKILSGVPESRFEAYARAYAGCGIDTNTSYRRSYARMYESVSCATHKSEKNYSHLYTTRPYDVHGRTVRLEALSADSHAEKLHQVTNGDAYESHKAYDANEIWGFLEFGPFATKEELVRSPVFQLQRPNHHNNQAAFAILSSLTDQMIGVIRLTHDEPQHLRIQMELPIVKLSADGTVEQMEACFLLLDRLFAHGYRRIQLAFDAQNLLAQKLPGQLGFTQEGLLPRHRIAKDSSVDDVVYGMLNSDWAKGARANIYKKLHGSDAVKADKTNEKREMELEVQQQQLLEKKSKK